MIILCNDSKFIEAMVPLQMKQIRVRMKMLKKGKKYKRQ